MSGNIAFICKKIHTEKILMEVGLMEDKSKTYTLTEKNIEEIIFENSEICKNLNVKKGRRI